MKSKMVKKTELSKYIDELDAKYGNMTIQQLEIELEKEKTKASLCETIVLPKVTENMYNGISKSDLPYAYKNMMKSLNIDVL
jgi:hypothetical protein